MEIQKNLDQKKELQNLILTYLETTEDTDVNCALIIKFVEDNDYTTKRAEFENFLYLLLQISDNHFREPDFNSKIQLILQHFEKEIKRTFSNIDIFNIFKSNKQIILYLITKKIIKVDKLLLNQMESYDFSKHSQYCHFFYPEIKTVINSKKLRKIEEDLKEIDLSIFENFEELRSKGQNETYICSLIRNDSVEDFISYVNQRNISIKNTRIPRSIFETNNFLIDKEPSLIEYAAFFGSIEIFQYLRLSNVELPSSLWLYLIHGKNAEMIHLLEENKILPTDKSFECCLIEAICCHHNDIANYIQMNLLENEKSDFNDKVAKKAIKYFNYAYFPENLNNNDLFFSLCKYKHLNIVLLLLNSKRKIFEKSRILNDLNL